MEFLLASKGAFTLDLIFFIAIILGILIGVWRGFLKSVLKLAGTIFALVCAFFFCTPMQNSLEKSFGLTSAIAEGVKSYTIASWIAVVISFVFIVVIVKFGAWFLGKVGTKVVGKVKALNIVNRVLGGLLGLFFAFLVISLILTVFNWINAPSINAFIGRSLVVGRIYEWKWFAWATRLPGRLL